MFEESFEAQIELFAQIDALQREKDVLLAGRTPNLPQNIAAYRKQNEKLKQQLKSDLKKSNAFVKKLKLINSEGILQCIRDTESLNLTLFISEIVNAIVATTYKATDASLMVKLCTCLHQKYEEFAEPLVTGLKQAIIAPPAEDDPEVGKRKRIQIRFIIELYQAGFFAEDEYFVRLLKNLLGKGKSGTKVDLQGLGTMVKYGSETLFAYVPRKMAELAYKTGKTPESMPVKAIVGPKVAAELRAMLQETYQQLCGDLVVAHQSFRTKEAKIEKDKLIHGTITETKQQEFDNAKKLYEKLFSIVSTLAECMSQEMPVLEIEKEEEDGTGGLTVWEGGREGGTGSLDDPAGPGSGGLFGDAETRAFYEELPDLLSAVPLTILGFTPEQAAALREQWEQEALQLQQATYGTGTASAEGTTDGNVEGDAGDGTDAAGADIVDSGAAEADLDITDDKAAAGADAEDGADESKSAKLLALLNEKLPECVNKQRVDEFCTSFCFLNTKNARKRLVQSLIRIPRTRAELTVTYSRIIAALSRIYPDIATPVLEALKREFFGMLRTKNQLHIESKLKNVRFLGELVKFRIAPPIVAFRMFRTLFVEFSNHSAQLLAVLLETCGRFLYLLPYTHERMNEILNTMLRLRRARNIDLSMQTLLEGAYFAVKPPERVARAAKKELTVVQQYARYLILEKLEEPRVSVETVIKSLRRLPWKSSEENVAFHIVKASLKVARSKYVSLPNLADCLSGLGSYHPNVVIQLVDRILEEVQRGLESPYKREIQRTLGLVRLLGELYNFTAISSIIVFDLLYHLINFGHTDANVSAALVERAQQAISSESAGAGAPAVPPLRVKYDARLPCDVDPPTDLFRAQVVCELLNTVGLYYVKGKPKEKLSRFLVYFQRYLLTKAFIPLHVEFSILDTLDSLEELAREAAREGRKPTGRGKAHAQEALGAMFPRFDTLEAAQAAVDVFEEVSEEERLRQEKENEAEEEAQESDDDAEDEDAGAQPGDNDGAEDSAEEGDGDDADSVENEEVEDAEEAAARRAEEEDRSEQMAARMMEKLRIAEEDDEFEKAFKNVLQESVHNVNTKSNDVNKMVIPAMLPKPKNAVRRHIDDEDEEVQAGSSAGAAGPAHRGVTFKLLSRDSKGRFETRQLQLPEDNQMAVRLAKAEETMKAEKQRLKERVLQIDQLTAEAEYEAAQERAMGFRDRDPRDRDSGGGSGYRAQPASSAGSSLHNTTSATSGAAPMRSQQQNLSGVSFGGYGRVAYAAAPGNNSGRARHTVVRGEDTKKGADTLNLDEFLAEADASDLRKISTKKSGKL